MPAFDLRGIKIAKYVNTSGTITYTDVQTIGDAMNVDLQLKFAEGRLYAESALAEYLKKATGGTISIGVKYIPDAAQTLMFGATAKTHSITTGGTTTTVSGLSFTSKDTPKYVGAAFYAPDMIDGIEKYTCVFVNKTLFGPPSLSYQTQGENIVFNTPTTTGEFLSSDGSDKQLFEVAVCDTEAQAQAWVTAVLA